MLESQYLNAWIVYNKKILDHLNNIPEQNRLVFRYDQISENQNFIFSFLLNKGFKIDKYDFNRIYQPSKMKKDKEVFKYASAEQIKTAHELYDQLLRKVNF